MLQGVFELAPVQLRLDVLIILKEMVERKSIIQIQKKQMHAMLRKVKVLLWKTIEGLLIQHIQYDKY